MTTNGPLGRDESEDLARIRASLYDWAFKDIKRAASQEVNLPRLAFVGLASWVDTVARLYGGNKGRPAWKKFIQAYLPSDLHGEKTVDLLYDGFRCALSHEYGTRGVALIDGQGELHWQLTSTGRILNLESLIEVFEEAWRKFYDDLQSNPALRNRVLPRSKGLLATVEVDVEVDVPHPAMPATLTLSPSLSASATGPEWH